MVVDETNLVAGELLGQKVIPLAAMVDELGILRFVSVGGPRETKKAIESILREESAAPPTRRAAPADIASIKDRIAAHPRDANLRLVAASALLADGYVDAATGELTMAAKLDPENWIPPFRLGTLLFREKKTQMALDYFKTALKLDPKNYLIRKQIWAIENPDKFYKGNVDYGWQQQQMRREAAGG